MHLVESMCVCVSTNNCLLLQKVLIMEIAVDVCMLLKILAIHLTSLAFSATPPVVRPIINSVSGSWGEGGYPSRLSQHSHAQIRYCYLI